MDGLSAAASGMAVISLSIQLVRSIDTISTMIRRVKGASTEIERLGRQLDVLKALLQDIHQMMQYQSSCSGETIPMPSTMIFDCMKGCERELEPFEKVLHGYEQRVASSGSRTAKLRRNLKLAFQAKDIADFEDKIQREVTRLQMALTVNNTRQLHTLQVLLGNQHCMLPSTTATKSCGQLPEPTNPPATMTLTLKDISSNLGIWTPLVSTRRRFGSWHQEIIHGTFQLSGRAEIFVCNDEVISHEDVYFLASRFLNYGIRCSRHRLFKTLLPCISVYPIIQNFEYGPMQNTFRHGTVSQLQNLFRTGALHPFTRDSKGRSLLHAAARHQRSDICQFLTEIGLKGDADFRGRTPWAEVAMGQYLFHNTAQTLQSTVRSLMRVLDPIDSTEVPELFYGLTLPIPSNSTWFWRNREDLFYYEDASMLASKFVKCLVSILSHPEYTSSACQSLKKCFPSQLRHFLEGDTIRVFDHVFLTRLWVRDLPGFYACDSFEVGKAFIETIADVGTNVDEFMQKEIAKYPELTLGSARDFVGPGQRSLVAERTQGSGWRLGWRRLFDDSEPGYLLVAELSSLVVETQPWCPWDLLFGQTIASSVGISEQESSIRDLRFERRMAAKSRKERARLGLKEPRSKMPGSWIP